MIKQLKLKYRFIKSLSVWPKSLAGQMIAVVLLGIALALAISLWMLGDAHEAAINRINRGVLVRQAATLTQVLEASPEKLHRDILKTTRRANAIFELSGESLVPDGDFSEDEQESIAVIVKYLGDEYKGRQIRVNFASERQEHAIHNRRDKYREQYRRDHDDRGYRPRLLYLNVSIQLIDGQWLNMQSATPKMVPLFARRTLIFLGLSAFCVLAGVIFMVRRITKPMGKLSTASNRLGLGEKIEPLQEEGPEDVREMIRAFNLMNERLQRFVADRTRMLAALSHDLRTPITSMRLRVDLMEPSSDTDQLRSTLEELQQMSEATLAFIRQDSDNEPTRSVDLNALLDSLCEDLQDIGLNVRYQEAGETIVKCRLVSLKRAIRNLIENGVKYGSLVEVSVEQQEGHVMISMQDEGDGVPEAMMEKVFEPFVRMEESRNRETGGMGLGLSIARNIIHSHGGDIQMTNNERGLLVRVVLPLAGSV